MEAQILGFVETDDGQFVQRGENLGFLNCWLLKLKNAALQISWKLRKEDDNLHFFQLQKSHLNNKSLHHRKQNTSKQVPRSTVTVTKLISSQ